MDIAVKTSLASYEFRAEGPKMASGSNARLNVSLDADEAMLALVDRQLLISGSKLRAGESRKAAELLRKTYNIAISHSSASPQGDKPLVVRLATALVRIQLSTALSQLDRHPQALEEATLAKHELDIVWHLMTGANVELAVADSLGDTTRPDPVLRRHIVHPPGWLERAIEASIVARLCMAVEMESILPDDQFQAALDSAEAMDAGLPPPNLQESATNRGNSKPKLQLRPVSRGAIGSEADESTRPSTRTSNRPVSRGALAANKFAEEEYDLVEEDLPVVGMPVPSFTTGQELQGLYREALRLGAKLLPSGHQARNHAERVEKQARTRWKQFIERSNPVTAQALSSRPNTEVHERGAETGDPSQEEATLTTDAQLPFLSRSPKLRRSTRPDSAFRSDYGSTVGSTEVGSKDFLMVPSSLLQSTDSFGSGAASHAEWSKNAPPGNVYFRSLPSSYLASSVDSDASSRKNKRNKKKKRGASPDGSPINAPAVAEPRERDPFRDWQKNYMDVGKMSLFQQKLMSLQGINSLQMELRDQRRQFSHYMKDLGALPDGDLRLGEDRILYCDHGVKALQAGQLKAAAVRKKAWHPSQKGLEAQQLEGDLFQYYGIPLPQDGVDLKSLKTLMKESFERSPEEKRRRDQEEAARKTREFEEERRKRSSLAAAFAFNKKEQEKPPAKANGRRLSMNRATLSVPAGLNLKA
eukprot:TRINITY_DN93063_c0_g1_i1.p1 TRINITY_DN93063_c0_g1~~TRINITY_DN93063_c0_g1_i1.p1  ORF type:complete len:711 (+),score=121.16 TRINITY_DN93063_c0_g1_i1:36-2135(+)